MLDVIQKLDLESRRSLFMVIFEAHRGTASELTPEMIASGLLRAPSTVSLCRQLGVDEAALMEELGAERSDVDTDTGFSQIVEPMSAPARSTTESPDTNQGWQAGSFVALPLSQRAKHAVESLARKAAGEAAESVKPAQALRWLLEEDQAVRDTCSRFGLTPTAIPDDGS